MRPHFAGSAGFLLLALLLGILALAAWSVVRTRQGHAPASLLLSASPLRATLETVLLAAALTTASLALTLPSLQTEGLVSPIDPTLVLLAGPVCALWCAARLRILRGPRWRALLVESGIGAILALMPFTIVVITAYASYLFLERQQGSTALILQQGIRGLPIPLFAVLLFVAFSLEFVIFRIGVRLWLRWNRLRRTQLQWSLTHGILVTAALAAGVLIVLILLLVSAASRTSIFTLVPAIFFLGFLTLLGLLIVLPPSAIFSYVFARFMTRRLDTLIAATSALRAGDYGARVPVAGEDEVAKLQANFNGMAADLERAVRELETERDHVARLLRSRRELVASVSHELRTPVATLRSYLESTRMAWDRGGGGPPATLRHDLEVMERETVALQALINDLFTLSRAEVATLDLVLAPTDVAALARRVVETMAPVAWQSNRVELVASAGADVPPVLADAPRLEQVLRNLLHNGMRHTPPGGIVAVEVASQVGGGGQPSGVESVLVRVKDTGEGIAPDDLSHVFDRFYRGKNAREGSGSGLGLALVKELTEAMGGTVSVASAPGHGAVFTFWLPVVVAPIASPSIHRQQPDQARASGAPTPGEVESPAIGR
jgi:signal transduction histidine kinase